MKAIVDCNSFYCSCERLFRPELRQQPVVVLSNNDGCIISRTDEAKALGIGMAGPYYQVKQTILQHGVSVFSSNYNLYGDLSQRVMESMRAMLPPGTVEVYSVDEAFLDLHHLNAAALQDFALALRQQVETWTGIAVSVGIAPSKTLAKVANRLAKKNKQATNCIMVLDNDHSIQEALQRTPVGDIWGIGRRYARKLQEMYNIENAWQLRQMNDAWASKNLGGIVGVRMLRELRGEDCIPMKDPLIKKQMIATTRMFGKAVYDLSELREAVATYTSRAAEKLRRQHGAAGSLTVFVVTNEVTDNRHEYNPHGNQAFTLLAPATSATPELISKAIPLLEQIYRKGPRYLKAGVMLGNIVPDNAIQANLFSKGTDQRQRMLMQAIDNVNFSMRDDAVKFARAGIGKQWKMRQELRSGRYTTRWNELRIVS